METIEAFACRVNGVAFAAGTEADLRRAVEGAFPGAFDGALVLHFCASVPAVPGGVGPAEPKRPPKSYVVRFPDHANHDEARAHYERELAAAGWAYDDTTMTDRALEAFVLNFGREAAALVRNYQTGVITGGELDMKAAELRGLIR